MTRVQMELGYLTDDQSYASNYVSGIRQSSSVYLCPLDDVPTQSGKEYKIRRSYRINGHDPSGAQGTFAKVCDKGIGIEWYSVALSEVEATADTILLAPGPRTNAYVGGQWRTDLAKPSDTWNDLSAATGQTGLHGDLRFNFLFVDGHVGTHLLYETVSGSPDDKNNANGMWSRQADD